MSAPWERRPVTDPAEAKRVAVLSREQQLREARKTRPKVRVAKAPAKLSTLRAGIPRRRGTPPATSGAEGKGRRDCAETSSGNS
jgi:hypothetical protein